MHEAGKEGKKVCLKTVFLQAEIHLFSRFARGELHLKRKGKKKDAILLDVSIVSSKFDEKKCFLLAKSRILPTARRPNGKRARKVMRVTGRRFMTICPASERTGV